VFAGVRNLVLCENEDERPGDGTEVSYVELEFRSKDALERFVRGKRVAAYYTEAPEEAEAYFDEALPARRGAYLLWLDPPFVQDGGCFCHFSWRAHAERAQVAFRIRDFLHDKLYGGVTQPTAAEQRPWKEVLPWDHFTAEAIWQTALFRLPCREGREASIRVDNRAAWRARLDKLTRKYAPNSARAKKLG
jgi:hypothetical protein